jgi:hypothetical protein
VRSFCIGVNGLSWQSYSTYSVISNYNVSSVFFLVYQMSGRVPGGVFTSFNLLDPVHKCI